MPAARLGTECQTFGGRHAYHRFSPHPEPCRRGRRDLLPHSRVGAAGASRHAVGHRPVERLSAWRRACVRSWTKMSENGHWRGPHMSAMLRLRADRRAGTPLASDKRMSVASIEKEDVVPPTSGSGMARVVAKKGLPTRLKRKSGV